ncbi:MAG TPA: sensor histidine kinase [Clostridiales bacterium]|nr:sensor histidine kinase [Clostridiales bacterium]
MSFIRKRHSKYNIKLRTKLMIFYLILITVVFGLYTLFSFFSISESSKEQMEEAADQVLKQTSELLNYKLDNIIYASDQLFYNRTMNNIIKRDRNLPLSPQLLSDLNQMKVLISSAFKNDDMYRLTLYLDSSVYYSQSYSITGNFKTQFSSISSIVNEHWYKKLLKFGGKVMWIEPSIAEKSDPAEVVISCVRFIKDMDSYTNIIGLLRFDLLQTDINRIVEKAAITNNGVVYLLNSEDKVMAYSNQSLTEKYKDQVKTIVRESRSNGEWKTINVGNEFVLIGAVPVKNTDWTLISVIPYMDLQAAGWQIINRILFFLMIAIPLSFAMSIMFSHSVTKRIYMLSKKMVTALDDRLPDYMEEVGSDEISMLIRSYNYMIKKIKEFSETQYRMGIDVKNAELKALQAQIDPHFLYNTLDLINWIALRNGVHEISDIVQKLTKFYKLSLSKGRDIISVREELAHIEIYVGLQNLRFNNRINLIIDVDQNIYRYSMPKLILQPIVENAILHGIFCKDSKTGTVTITGKMDNNNIRLSISDDGVGMDPAKAESLFRSDNHKEEKGYGIINVNHRIKLFFGNDFGMTCHSKLGEGTVVEIVIPAILAE